ncbi:MAG: dihydroorotase [Planctomycetota bacterium]|jgi:dihydroorotase
MSHTIRLRIPDDAHLHLRDGAALAYTVPASANTFARVVVMPNLGKPVTTVAEALAYRARILAEVPRGSDFDPLMALYLTERMNAEEIRRAADSPKVLACKLYPHGATTNSDSGVEDLETLFPVFEAMQRFDLPLLVHGEATDVTVDIFDREKAFIDRSLEPISDRFPDLRIVFEHVTTADAVQFVEQARPGIAATITPQHLLMNRNDLFENGLQPHNYCLPVLKRQTHQLALRKAVQSGSSKFFLGTDSAPHARLTKERSCGCAGCYSAPAALPLYAQVFDELGALDHLNAFASQHAASFYGWALNAGEIQLKRESWTVPASLPFADEDTIVPFWADRELRWQISSNK